MCTICCLVLVPAILANTSATNKFGHTHNHIPAFLPLLVPMLMPQPPPTAPLTCIFRHTWPCPYPLSPFQSNANTSHPWLTVSASHAWIWVGMPCRSAHHSFWLPRYSCVLHQFNIKTYTFPLPVPTIPSLTFSTTKLAISYLCFQGPLLFSNPSVKISSIFNARQQFGIEK